MYTSIADFLKEWNREAMLTEKVFEGLTDASLKQEVYPEGRTLGRIAWHITTSIPEYLAEFGLKLDLVENGEQVPVTAKEITNTLKEVCEKAALAIEQQWTDQSLKVVQNAFGRQETNASIIMGLIKHIVHHRGQMTVLIRQAGIKPFGVYGPPKEDWVHLGVENPPL
ncbi:hypothetical protein EKG37_06840 [Robertmurraya yapensis]|uniref:DUF664 domain-containing protein n=2 Tax=Bacillaceae TaxID=186817 RepID=A0A3S0KTA6_9BACI|nr:DinB family protein [Bacillus yapensis]RTR33925.1 hypothetical protein EKG37_06840 [Bacillus yapensis]TKS97243.1 hypothetical protein FAR12_06840 [Bacillus yapensis]